MRHTKIFFYVFLSLVSYFCSAQSLHFLFITKKFPWYTQSSLACYLKGLSQRGHKVDVFSELEGDNCSLIVDETYSLFVKKLPKNIKKYDVIVCNNLFLANRYVDLRKKLKKDAKFIAYITGPDIQVLDSSSCNTIIKTYDLFLVTNGFAKYRAFIKGVPEKKMVLHYTPIDFSLLPFRLNIVKKDRTVTILVAHELCDYKAIETLIYAIRDGIIQYCPKFRCIIVGDGPERKRLEKLAKRLEKKKSKLKGKIIFKGWMPHHKLLDLMNKSHILVVPAATTKNGVRDGISNTMKEAMAMGLPIIATRHPANMEVVENKFSGLLMSERDISWMSHHIRHMLRHEEYWIGWALEAREKVMKMFDIDKCVDELLTFVTK